MASRIRLFTLSVLVLAGQGVFAGELPAQRQNELRNLLLQDCGSCHGMTLKGGLGPALTPDIMATRSRDMVRVTIEQGRSGTPMPPWKNMLSKDDIDWLVDTLYKGNALK